MLEIFVLGRFSLRSGGSLLPDRDWGKAGELLAWLLLHRNRRVAREEVAQALWPESTPERIGKNFAQALWRLRSLLEIELGWELEDFLTKTPKWLCCELNPEVTLDAARLDQVWTLTQGVRGREFTPELEQLVREAVDLYRGELLPGWYMDWCLRERERCRSAYLELLDKLMDACEWGKDYESGLAYGQRSLRLEPACERTHRRVMRLYTLAGNRTAALRQFDRCREVLRQELDTEPDTLTRELARQIRENCFDGRLPVTESGAYPLALPAPVDRQASPAGKPTARADTRKLRLTKTG